MLAIAQTNLFKKQLKQARKRGWNMDDHAAVVELLQREEQLPERYRDHALSGDRAGQRDCHVKPDWVLIYKVRSEVLVLELLETGTHSDLGL
jgi:mRNA interferase YafQ